MLSEDELKTIIRKGYQSLGLEEDEDIIGWLAQQSSGDARRALNQLELLTPYLKKEPHKDIKQLAAILEKKTLYYDKDREEHYNLILLYINLFGVRTLKQDYIGLQECWKQERILVIL
jgi:replication-associated recombination protein RarA